MAFATHSRKAGFATINVTPLVDVMLVLLVIFMVTAPMLTHTIGLDLPGKAPSASVPASAPVTLRIDAAGGLYWNDDAIALEALQARMQVVLGQDPLDPPLLRIQANAGSDYGVLARVLAAARNADWQRVAFVVD